MYRKQIKQKPFSLELTEYISFDLPDGAVCTFENIESNDGPEKLAYLKWVEAGGVAEVVEA